MIVAILQVSLAAWGVQDSQHGRYVAGGENLESLKQGTMFGLY